MRLQLCCEKLAGLLHSLRAERLKCVSLCSAAMTLKWRIMGTSGVWVQCWGIWSRRGRTPHVSESYIVPFSPLHVVLHSDAHAELPSSTVALCSCMSEQKCHSRNASDCLLSWLISDTGHCSWCTHWHSDCLSQWIFPQVSLLLVRQRQH